MRSRWMWLLAGSAAVCWSVLPARDASAAGTAGTAQTAEHKVRAGDNLHLMAGYYYKDPRQWKRIWRANRAAVRRPSVLKVGAVLRVELEPGTGWEIPYEEFVARASRR